MGGNNDLAGGGSGITMDELNEAAAIAKTIDEHKRMLEEYKEGPLRFPFGDMTIELPEEDRGFICRTIENRIRTLEDKLRML